MTNTFNVIIAIIVIIMASALSLCNNVIIFCCPVWLTLSTEMQKKSLTSSEDADLIYLRTK